SAPSNSIGGTAAGTANLISGNANDGVTLAGAAATGNTVQGNLIGTDITGNAALKNGRDGVVVSAPSATVGGTTAAARNIISGNGRAGVTINGAAATGDTIQGNYVGTNLAGA